MSILDMALVTIRLTVAHVAVSRNRGSFSRGFWLLERSLALGRCRAAPYENHMAVSRNWGLFFVAIPVGSYHVLIWCTLFGSFHELRVFFVTVLEIRALVGGVYRIVGPLILETPTWESEPT